VVYALWMSGWIVGPVWGGAPVLGADGGALGLVRSRALAPGLELAVYIEDMFKTGNDEDNRAAVRAVTAEEMLRGMNVPRRSRMLADGYGMSGTDRARVIEVAMMRTPPCLVPDEAARRARRRRLAANVGRGRRRRHQAARGVARQERRRASGGADRGQRLDGEA
jgi:hypothetical protein